MTADKMTPRAQTDSPYVGPKGNAIVVEDVPAAKGDNAVERAARGQASPAADSCGNFLPDAFKALVGSFAGAGLAFLANIVLQRRIEKRDNLAAGRLALLRIRS
jgi:hypothetical protein